jgi:hypothetical protein
VSSWTKQPIQSDGEETAITFTANNEEEYAHWNDFFLGGNADI